MQDSWYGAADVAYIRQTFVTLETAADRGGLTRQQAVGAVALGYLPKPSYRVAGEDWVPNDYLALWRAADEQGERIGGLFRERLAAAHQSAYGRPMPAAEGERAWRDYLSGDYGVCLWVVSPESIVRKGWLIEHIQHEVRTRWAGPVPQRAEAQERSEVLAALVRELDALERPFAAGDRLRFGGPSSRDIHVTGVRALLNLA